MQEQVLKIHLKDQESLGLVRCLPQLQAATEGDWIWLRGLNSEKLSPQIQQLPARQSFILDANNHLFPIGKITPIGKLPSLKWKRLTEFLKVELPVSALPAQVSKTQAIRLKKADVAKESVALLSDITTWKDYAHQASNIRLQVLKFAASNEGRVLIWGTPLPNIPGQTFWWTEHCFLPNGYDFDLPIVAKILVKKMELEGESALLFDKMGNWQEIDLEDFVEARRTAIRAL